MADTLRGTMDVTKYKRVVLGLIFLKCVSDKFEEHRSKLDSIQDAEPDAYRTQNILWIPPEGRWTNIITQARHPTIGQVVDGAMAAIERENPTIKNALPKDYDNPTLNKTRLGQIIDLINNIQVDDVESKDMLGVVYEYFLSRFVIAEGKKGGESYTPRSVARLLVEMLQPYSGCVYDPCCGTSGMFVQSAEFIDGDRNEGKTETISMYGQESNHATWQLAKMNLAMRGIDSSHIMYGDSFHDDLHPDLKADFILANPPLNDYNWGGEHLHNDQRWTLGIPPNYNANFAWVQHVIYHMAPSGTAGFVLANGTMSSNRSGVDNIRRNMVEANLVDCIVSLPNHLFYSTQVSACLWFLSRNRIDQKDSVLFIDARQMGEMIDRTHRELTDDDIRRMSSVYRAWCGDKQVGEYSDVLGFCKSVTLDELRKHGHVLTPGYYVGVEPQTYDESLEKKLERLILQWSELQTESEKLDMAITENIKNFGLNVEKV